MIWLIIRERIKYKEKLSNNMITGLPEWENEQEYVLRKVINT